MSTLATINARLFNQDTGSAKKMALVGPVVITHKGEPSHVLLSYAHFKKLVNRPQRLSDMLSMGDADLGDFQPQALRGSVASVEF